ncbi:hypothetical protein G3O08_09965 [Cryomorpha ignava]|uniref:PorT family protein n=1 Tax=Cryomorpha ignava TaxID=101383 RepID=A0A7K3WQI8_9FLAO|nr:hypothetical protein [Cryomorpha ignava]NEN23826.1 hypothetical protein [Cryomorpha ignava]
MNISSLTNYKKSILIVLTLFLGQGVFGQNGFYAGVEMGVLSGRFHYTNEKGYSLSQGSVGTIVGVHFGKRKNGFYYQTGIYRSKPYHPFAEINYDTWKPSKSFSASDGIENYRIPLYVGKEFKIYKRFYGGVGLGFNTIISRDVGVVSGFGTVYYDPSQPVLTATGDSTWGVVRVESRWNFGFESVFTIGMRSKGNFDYFLKAGYLAHFKPFSNETIIHYSNQETITASRVGLNSLTISFGLSYRFRNRIRDSTEKAF